MTPTKQPSGIWSTSNRTTRVCIYALAAGMFGLATWVSALSMQAGKHDIRISQNRTTTQEVKQRLERIEDKLDRVLVHMGK